MHPPRLTLGKMQNPVRGILHGTAAVVSLVGTVVLLVRGRTAGARIALAVYGLGMVTLYTISSLYHSIPWPKRWKFRMQLADHSAIFGLIAGTYTPIAAIVFDGWWRWGTLAVVWGIALVGISQLTLFPRPHQYISVTLHVTLGWLGLFILVPLAQRLPVEAVVLTLAGGIVYTIGMVFLVTGRPRLWPRVFSHHEVFHVMVVTASALHYVMTFRYVAPFTGV